jgi:hypothetical protein
MAGVDQEQCELMPKIVRPEIRQLSLLPYRVFTDYWTYEEFTDADTINGMLRTEDL